MPIFLTLRIVDVSRGRVSSELYADWAAISLRVGALIGGGLYILSVYRGREGEIEADRFAAKALHAWMDRLVRSGAGDFRDAILGDAGRVVAKEELIHGLAIDNSRLRPGQLVFNFVEVGGLGELSSTTAGEYNVASELLWQFDRPAIRRASAFPTVEGSLERISRELIRVSRYRSRALRTVQTLDAADMAEICGVRMPSRVKLRKEPSSYLRAGALAIWQNDQYVFPMFQICQETALVRAEIAQVLTALPLDTSGWTQFLWLLQRNKLLGWARPAVLLQTDPMSVLRAARLRPSG